MFSRIKSYFWTGLREIQIRQEKWLQLFLLLCPVPTRAWSSFLISWIWPGEFVTCSDQKNVVQVTVCQFCVWASLGLGLSLSSWNCLHARSEQAPAHLWKGRAHRRAEVTLIASWTPNERARPKSIELCTPSAADYICIYELWGWELPSGTIIL